MALELATPAARAEAPDAVFKSTRCSLECGPGQSFPNQDAAIRLENTKKR